MTEMMSKARARVTVTLEIDIPGGHWGEGCAIGQVYKQAKDGAITALMQGVIIGNKTIGRFAEASARIVGEPKVTMVLVEEP